jgi:hypothetical protein
MFRIRFRFDVWNCQKENMHVTRSNLHQQLARAMFIYAATSFQIFCIAYNCVVEQPARGKKKLYSYEKGTTIMVAAQLDQQINIEDQTGNHITK